MMTDPDRSLRRRSYLVFALIAAALVAATILSLVGDAPRTASDRREHPSTPFFQRALLFTAPDLDVRGARLQELPPLMRELGANRIVITTSAWLPVSGGGQLEYPNTTFDDLARIAAVFVDAGFGVTLHGEILAASGTSGPPEKEDARIRDAAVEWISALAASAAACGADGVTIGESVSRTALTPEETASLADRLASDSRVTVTILVHPEPGGISAAAPLRHSLAVVMPRAHGPDGIREASSALEAFARARHARLVCYLSAPAAEIDPSLLFQYRTRRPPSGADQPSLSDMRSALDAQPWISGIVADGASMIDLDDMTLRASSTALRDWFHTLRDREAATDFEPQRTWLSPAHGGG